MECLLDPLDYEYPIFCLDLSYGVSVEVIEGNLTRCQRAPKGAKQSATCRRDQIV
jgi:hypothetical protein